MFRHQIAANTHQVFGLFEELAVRRLERTVHRCIGLQVHCPHLPDALVLLLRGLEVLCVSFEPVQHLGWDNPQLDQARERSLALPDRLGELLHSTQPAQRLRAGLKKDMLGLAAGGGGGEV